MGARSRARLFADGRTKWSATFRGWAHRVERDFSRAHKVERDFSRMSLSPESPAEDVDLAAGGDSLLVRGHAHEAVRERERGEGARAALERRRDRALER